MALATGMVAFASDAPVHSATSHRKPVVTRAAHHVVRARHAEHLRSVSRTASHARSGRSEDREAARTARTSSHRETLRASRRSPHAHWAQERASELRIRRERIEEEAVARRHRAEERVRHSAAGEERVSAHEDRAALERRAEALRSRRLAEAEAVSLRKHRREIEERAAREPLAPRQFPAPESSETQAPALSPAVASGFEQAGISATGAEPAAGSFSRMAERTSFSTARMPAPLRGSLASLERQDERLEADGLERIEDENDLSARIQNHLLVPLPVSDALTVNQELLPHHRYCRPWTARFLADLARAHEAVFHRPLEVNSAVRTVAYEKQLMRINGNAAPAVGNIVSPHIMGATVDIAKKQMSLQEIAWMRRVLLALELEGKIDVEEEFEQACFHITVYRDYAPRQRAPQVESDGSRASQADADSGNSGQ